MLTSTQPWAKGLELVLERLGPSLAARVVGFTHEDLTTKVRVGARELPFSERLLAPDEEWGCQVPPAVAAAACLDCTRRRDSLLGARGVARPCGGDRRL